MKDMSAAYRANQEIIRNLRSKSAERGLTLATLCDMVLGEDAEDRSDDALIRAVGTMMSTQPCGHPVQAISQNKSGTQYCRWCVDMDNRYLNGWQDCASAVCPHYDKNIFNGACGHEKAKGRRCAPGNCPYTL